MPWATDGDGLHGNTILVEWLIGPMPLNEPFGKIDDKTGRFKNQVSSREKGKCNLPKSFFKMIIAALESNRRTLSMIYDTE